jgi:hypothetical protein
MRQIHLSADIFILILILSSSGFSSCHAQESFGTNLLQLDRKIPMPGIKGRIDHMDVNLKDQVVYVAALGNNTVEAISLRDGKTIYSIQGMDEPQGIGYIPQNEEIFVANGGTGDCYFYNAKNFNKTGTIHLSSDADDVRYDSAERKIYVGYGEGGIAIIDAISHKQISDVKLPAHPESFQIDKQEDRLFVNVPKAKMIGVIDLVQLKLTDKWIRNEPTDNYPMALDAINHRIFAGYRHPPKLLVLNKTGKEVNIISMAGDADDLYYYAEMKEVIVSGGDGHISIYKQENLNKFNQVANIPTRKGARTSLLIPQLNTFVLAARAESGMQAELMLYSLAPKIKQYTPGHKL